MSKTLQSARHPDTLSSWAFTALCLGITLLMAVAGCQKDGTLSLTSFRAADADLRRGDRLYAEQREDEARLVYQEILRKNPAHAGASARLGRMAFAAGQYDEALRLFRDAMKSDPANFHYALSFAQTQSRMATTAMDRPRAMEAAERAYRHAQSLDPKNFAATIELAMCYREQGNFDRAIDTLREAARLHPDAAAIHVQLGEIYHSQGAFDKAIDEFKLALKSDPNNLAAHNGCGIVNTAISSNGGAKSSIARERAMAHFRRSLQINGNQPQVRGMLAQLEPYEWKAVTVAEEAPE